MKEIKKQYPKQKQAVQEEKKVDIDLSAVKAKLKEQLTQKLKKYKTIPTGVACPEPCSFDRCLNTCWQEMDVVHHEHCCSDHCHKVKPQSEQIQLETDTDTKTVFQNLRKEKLTDSAEKIFHKTEKKQETTLTDAETDFDSAMEESEPIDLVSDSSEEDGEATPEEKRQSQEQREQMTG